MAQDYNGSLLGKLFDAQVIEVLSPSADNPTFKYRVRIPPLHQGLTDEQLPFAIAMKRLFVGSTANVGWSSCPREGSWVKVLFDGGVDMSIFIIGESFGKNQLINGFSKDDYGYIDQYGNIMKVNVNGDFNYTTTHNISVTANGGLLNIIANGAKIQIDTNGNIDMTATNNLNLTSTTDVVIKSTDITLDGNVNVTGGLNVVGSTVLSDASMTSADIGGVSFATHKHTAGTYISPSGDVSGISGAVSG